MIWSVKVFRNGRWSVRSVSSNAAFVLRFCCQLSCQHLRLLLCAEGAVHRVCCVSHHGGHDVSVCVHRDGDLRMSEYLHDSSRLDALSEKQGSAAMAEIMEAESRQFSTFESRLVLAEYVSRI